MNRSRGLIPNNDKREIPIQLVCDAVGITGKLLRENGIEVINVF